MPDLCVEYTVGDMKMNEAGADTLVPRSITGLHGRPITGTVFNKGATNDSKKLTHRLRGRVIEVRAVPLIVAVIGDPTSKGIDIPSNLNTYLTRLNTLMDAWVSFLEGKLNTSFTLSYTPTGGSLQSHTVTYGVNGGEFEMDTEEEFGMFHPLVHFSLFQESG